MGRLEGLLDRLDGTVDTEELGGTLQHFDGKEYWNVGKEWLDVI